MNHEKLVRMANQIADFFKSYPEEQAQAGIRDHIVAYWTPGMRRADPGRAGRTGVESPGREGVADRFHRDQSH